MGLSAEQDRLRISAFAEKLEADVDALECLEKSLLATTARYLAAMEPMHDEIIGAVDIGRASIVQCGRGVRARQFVQRAHRLPGMAW